MSKQIKFTDISYAVQQFHALALMVCKFYIMKSEVIFHSNHTVLGDASVLRILYTIMTLEGASAQTG